MKNFKILMHIVILFGAIILFINVTYGWYVANDKVDASGIEATTEDQNMTYTIEYYNGTSYVNNLNSISNAFPGSVSYFRVKIEGTDLEPNDYNYEMTISSVSSKITDNTIKVTNSTVTYDSVKLYDIENNKVTYASKTLYNVSGTSLTLCDYKIESVYKLYSNCAYNDTLPDTANTLTETINISKDMIKKDTNYYYYFALEFNEEASLVKLNDTLSVSNPYMFQTLVINSIKIERLDS